ncbi:MAG TPA: hypothetical protein VHJ39_10475 [Solirubrobacteraceae bacterium]|nr:hypothetical protein [Solirubrobacteraceae bacterium]
MTVLVVPPPVMGALAHHPAVDRFDVSPVELVVSGGAPPGYRGDPDATAALIDADGWLHTGDLGHVDADGDVWIVDRLKELIKVGGLQVAPAELEALLATHPQVADAAWSRRPTRRGARFPSPSSSRAARSTSRR